jgi:hypothetical protein
VQRRQLTRERRPQTGLVVVLNVGNFAEPMDDVTTKLVACFETTADAARVPAYLSNPWKAVWQDVVKDAKQAHFSLEPVDLPATVVYRDGVVKRVDKNLDGEIGGDEFEAIVTRVYKALEGIETE